MLFVKKCCYSAILVLLFFVLFSVTSYATPTFYLSPGDKANTDLTGDEAFQTSVAGYDLVEEDFERYSVGQYQTLTIDPNQTYGNVDVNLSNPDIFDGHWIGGTGSLDGLEGAIYENTLESNTGQFTFTFSGQDIVTGFGVWIYDDMEWDPDSFTMTVEDLDGNTWTSSVLDSNPDPIPTDPTYWGHAIDGFLGVTLDEGIKSITINELSSPGSGYFQMDHMQIASKAPVPEPTTMLLFGTGIAGLAAVGRRKRD